MSQTPYRTFGVRLAARATLSPGFVRITLAGDDLGGVGPVVTDQRVKLLLGDADALAGLTGIDAWHAAWQALPEGVRPAMRTYTLVAVRRDGDAGEVDIDVVIHPADGPAPGMAFAARAPLGTPAVLVAGALGRPGHDTVGVAWHPGRARDVTIVGDETALPAIANIAATLPDHATGAVWVEVPHAADVRSLPVPPGVQVRWRVREAGERVSGVFGRPGGPVADDGELLWDEADGGGSRYGWVAGEAGWVRALRAEARDAGVDRRQVAFMGYWKRGSAGS